MAGFVMTRATELAQILRSFLFATALAATSPLFALGKAPAPAITGEVRSLHAQPIYTPASSGGTPVVLRYYIEDGSEVPAGEPVLRIDPGQTASRLRTIIAERSKAEATAAKDLADLEVKALDAELALVDAEANFAKAKIDAALPRELVSALDYDRYQGDRDRTERELALKQRELAAARAAVARKRQDAELETHRFQLEQKFLEAKLKSAEVRAERAGVVLHGMDPTGKRFDEGSTSFTGMLVGEVVSPGAMAVRAYALEADRTHFSVGAKVNLTFDALPEAAAIGQITSISGAPRERLIWGEGRYFTLEIELPADAQHLPMLPGMSVKVQARP